MAVCPNCHVMDKPFFAGKCYACTAEVTFVEQVLTSLIWTVTTIAVWAVIIWLLFAIFG